MSSCCAYGCSNRSENGFSLNVFPKDKQCRPVWAVEKKEKNGGS